MNLKCDEILKIYFSSAFELMETMISEKPRAFNEVLCRQKSENDLRKGTSRSDVRKRGAKDEIR